MLLLLILGALLAVAYYTSSSSTVAPDEALEQEVASTEVINILTDLQGVDFNFSVLQNGALTFLKNISMPALGLPVGRQNPFAPVK